MEREEFKRQLEQLMLIVIEGSAYFHAWRGLMVDDRISARGLNNYHGFFVPARQALLKMTLLEFAAVFDTDSRAVSFTNLLGEAKRDRQNLIPYATDDSLRETERKIRVNKDLLKRLKRYRDQGIAHHDRIAPRHSVTYERVQALVEDVQSMYNLLLAGHEQNARVLFEWTSRDAHKHTYQLVGVLREQVEKR